MTSYAVLETNKTVRDGQLEFADFVTDRASYLKDLSRRVEPLGTEDECLTLEQIPQTPNVRKHHGHGTSDFPSSILSPLNEQDFNQQGRRSIDDRSGTIILTWIILNKHLICSTFHHYPPEALWSSCHKDSQETRASLQYPYGFELGLIWLKVKTQLLHLHFFPPLQTTLYLYKPQPQEEGDLCYITAVGKDMLQGQCKEHIEPKDSLMESYSIHRFKMLLLEAKGTCYPLEITSGTWLQSNIVERSTMRMLDDF
ncbi:hypothetical protein Tco_0212530 [Tanacetum coccineum]